MKYVFDYLSCSILLLPIIFLSHALALTPPMKGSVYIALTVDGFIATPDGGVDFLTPFQESADDDMGFTDFMNEIDVIVMGRKSFEKVISFGPEVWPYGDTLVVVWTRGGVEIPEVRKDTVTYSSLKPSKLMKELAQKGYKHAYIDGGTTIRQFLKAEQIQEMILTRVPILLGKGISLFGDSDQQATLTHVKTKSYKNGLVMSRYRLKKEDPSC